MKLFKNMNHLANKIFLIIFLSTIFISMRPKSTLANEDSSISHDFSGCGITCTRDACTVDCDGKGSDTSSFQGNRNSREGSSSRGSYSLSRQTSEQNHLYSKLNNAFKKYIQPHCFTGETTVIVRGHDSTIEEKPISELQVGDEIFSCSYSKNSCEFKPIVELSSRIVKQIFVITVNGIDIQVTGEHPFQAGQSSPSWKMATHLTQGDFLYDAKGHGYEIENKIEKFGEFEVFNIEVEATVIGDQVIDDDSNYSVTSLGLIVHNCNLIGSGALIGAGAVFLGGGPIVGVALPMIGGAFTFFKMAEASDLEEVGKDLAFDVAVSITAAKTAGIFFQYAKEGVLWFGKQVKPVRDKILKYTAELRSTPQMLQLTSKSIEENRKIANVFGVKVLDSAKKSKLDTSVVSNPAHNPADYVRLKTSLKFMEEGVLDVSGKLTSKALSESTQRIVGSELKNTAAISELTRDGSKIADWGKYSTKHITHNNGQKLQIHYYKNNVTGNVNYNIDFKVDRVVQ